MSTILLDTHVVQWWSAEPERISQAAINAINDADELAVAAITWFELAWLAKRERIVLTVPVQAWLERLATNLTTVDVTPAIADTAASLPSSFPGDPADRLIYATAVERDFQLVTKDRKLRNHRHTRTIAIW